MIIIKAIKNCLKTLKFNTSLLQALATQIFSAVELYYFLDNFR